VAQFKWSCWHVPERILLLLLFVVVVVVVVAAAAAVAAAVVVIQSYVMLWNVEREPVLFAYVVTCILLFCFYVSLLYFVHLCRLRNWNLCS
jgi:hypothetical protein